MWNTLELQEVPTGFAELGVGHVAAWCRSRREEADVAACQDFRSRSAAFVRAVREENEVRLGIRSGIVANENPLSCRPGEALAARRAFGVVGQEVVRGGSPYGKAGLWGLWGAAARRSDRPPGAGGDGLDWLDTSQPPDPRPVLEYWASGGLPDAPANSGARLTLYI